MENSNIKYSEALAELEKILAQLRADNSDIDTLAERTRRAATLLSECRARLTRTEEELNKILAEFDQSVNS
ncbi:MAG: exodeoxyribonuclease VII small subunit [Muribaculaceae bacterium]|nr:exodeoxyribonuclease VII small subunit [Muribaculaceae bacterium]MDE6564013.1 exodeoxyribonuclease VII small subunit [Muribaculaceae bacterium]